MLLGEKHQLNKAIKAHLEASRASNVGIARISSAIPDSNNNQISSRNISSTSSHRNFLRDTSAIKFDDGMDEHFEKGLFLDCKLL